MAAAIAATDRPSGNDPPPADAGHTGQPPPAPQLRPRPSPKLQAAPPQDPVPERAPRLPPGAAIDARRCAATARRASRNEAQCAWGDQPSTLAVRNPANGNKAKPPHRAAPLGRRIPCCALIRRGRAARGPRLFLHAFFVFLAVVIERRRRRVALRARLAGGFGDGRGGRYRRRCDCKLHEIGRASCRERVSECV